MNGSTSTSSRHFLREYLSSHTRSNHLSPPSRFLHPLDQLPGSSSAKAWLPVRLGFGPVPVKASRDRVQPSLDCVNIPVVCFKRACVQPSGEAHHQLGLWPSKKGLCRQTCCSTESAAVLHLSTRLSRSQPRSDDGPSSDVVLMHAVQV